MTKIKIKQFSDRLEVQNHQLQSDSDFFSFMDHWNELPNIQSRPVEVGVDRAQCHFEYKGEEFIWFYEYLCDALWIEPFSQKDNLTNVASIFLEHNRSIFSNLADADSI